jgi:hypothetical protein
MRGLHTGLQIRARRLSRGRNVGPGLGRHRQQDHQDQEWKHCDPLYSLSFEDATEIDAL